MPIRRLCLPLIYGAEREHFIDKHAEQNCLKWQLNETETETWHECAAIYYRIDITRFPPDIHTIHPQ